MASHDRRQKFAFAICAAALPILTRLAAFVSQVKLGNDERQLARRILHGCTMALYFLSTQPLGAHALAASPKHALPLLAHLVRSGFTAVLSDAERRAAQALTTFDARSVQNSDAIAVHMEENNLSEASASSNAKSSKRKRVSSAASDGIAAAGERATGGARARNVEEEENFAAAAAASAAATPHLCIETLSNFCFHDELRALVEQHFNLISLLERLMALCENNSTQRHQLVRALCILGKRPQRVAAAHRDHSKRHVRILSLDGGGTRGLVAISILRELELKLNAPHAPGDARYKRLHEFFDLICGTSTGGIIAFCIAVLHLDIDEIKHIYSSLCGEVFSGSYKR